MPKIKLNLKSLSTGEKVDKARQIVKALTGNPSFTTPQPPLATVTTAANDLAPRLAMRKAQDRLR